MNAPEVLERITAAGIRLTANGGNIIASPRAAVTPEVVELIRAHKPELLAVIYQKQSPLMQADQKAELVRLVNLVADYHEFTPEQRAEAIERAAGDAQAALECFRELAAGIPMPEPSCDRRQRVLAMLTARPDIQYAIVTDSAPETDSVVVALAIRDVGTCELAIPRTKYDGVLLLDLIEKHSGTVH